MTYKIAVDDYEVEIFQSSPGSFFGKILPPLVVAVADPSDDLWLARDAEAVAGSQEAVDHYMSSPTQLAHAIGAGEFVRVDRSRAGELPLSPLQLTTWIDAARPPESRVRAAIQALP